jgi:hypothetical protein
MSRSKSKGRRERVISALVYTVVYVVMSMSMRTLSRAKKICLQKKLLTGWKRVNANIISLTWAQSYGIFSSKLSVLHSHHDTSHSSEIDL